jgi:ankyrin repeat protein
MAMADLMSREWSLSALDYELSFRHYDSLIIRAVKKYAIQILQVLLEEKLNASSVDILGRSALHWACKLGEYGKAELLIQHGLRLHSRDARHTTPLDLAVDAGGINPAVALVEAESRAESTEPMLRCITPLAIACRCNRDDVVHEIIKRGGDVNGTGSDSPLDMALRWGDPALVRLLLERGAKLSSVAASDRVLLQRGRHLDYIGSDQLYRKPLYRDANEKIAILQQHTTWKPLERARAGGTSRYSGR